MSEQSKEYQRGYVAGRKRQQRDIDQIATQAERDKLWNAAFLAALPMCITLEGWTSGGKPITSLSARTALAASFANEALAHLRVPVVTTDVP